VLAGRSAADIWWLGMTT